ncbi:MAG: hypothetical protein IJL06_08055 [Kiritimatiellae bacterium]|nr:hypothetical protein [Kiritimatiellia bacterium]
MNKLLRTSLAAALCAGLVSSVRADDSDASAALAAAKTWADSLSGGDFAAVYGALPPSFRTALSDAAKTLGETADRSVLEQARSSAEKLALAATKNSGFLADFLSRQGIPSGGTADGAAPAVVRVASRLAGVARAATPEKLASGDVAGILSAPALSLPGVTDALKPAPASGARLAARANADGSVTVGIPGGTPSQTVRMVKREGTWVPKPVADAFEDSGSWKTNLSGWTDTEAKKMQAKSALAMLSGTAASVASAGTQEDFDMALTGGAIPLLMLAAPVLDGSGDDPVAGAVDALLDGFFKRVGP